LKKTQKLLALLLATLFILSLMTACGEKPTTETSASPSPSAPPASSEPSPSTEPSPAVDPNRELNIQAMQDNGTLFPLGVTGGFIAPLYAFYEPLYDTRVDGTRRWMLATGLDRISDLQYTLTIREGVKFNNGNPLTADDVMFTMEQCAADPQFFLNVKVVDFEKTKVTGEYTIDLWYTQYNASQEPGFASMLIMDKESFDEVKLSTEPIGTGPYVVKEYVVNSHLSVTARDDYWGGTPNIKNINFKVINEASQIVNALETKDVDMAGPIQVSDVEYVKELGYNVTMINGGYPDVTLFSCLPGGPLESKEARWAVSHAIDRQAIVDVVYEGLSTVAVYPASQFDQDFEDRFANIHDTYSIGYNPEKAKELAEQSGLVGKTLRLITNGATNYNTMAEMIQANLLDIGVKAEIINYDQATYFPTIMDAANFDIALFNPAAPSMLAIDILAMYPTFVPLGWTGPDRDEYGVISMDAIGTYDKTERGNKLFEAIKMWVDIDPWYALTEVVAPRAMSADLTGIQYNISGSIFYQDIAFAG
jgi:peptide/nickel transport system substrate-binding protein